MPNKLPAQLAWREFACVLRLLNYELYESKPGSARVFYNANAVVKLVTFHEPHGKNPLREGTLREYIRKLQITREQFLDLLDKC